LISCIKSIPMMMIIMIIIIIIMKPVHVEFKNKSDTSNNRDNWKRFIITQKMQGKNEIKELQNKAILGTIHILRKVLT
jgi:uncharacterized membrane protein